MLSGRELSALRVNAITDPLTGLYNRRFLYDHLQREMSRAERTGGVVSLMMMDLQGFKTINDRLGHPVGDTVLVKTAKVIRDSLRAVDAGCRYGGDEFVAVLPNTTLMGSLAVAERIRQRVAKIQLPRRIGLTMGLHYGVATFPSDGRTSDFLIRTCDQRLYDCRRYNSDPRTRRHPRFAVSGLGLRLAKGAWRRQREFEVKDIGYGGLAFIYPNSRAAHPPGRRAHPGVRVGHAPRHDEAGQREAAQRRALARGLRLRPLGETSWSTTGRRATLVRPWVGTGVLVASVLAVIAAGGLDRAAQRLARLRGGGGPRRPRSLLSLADARAALGTVRALARPDRRAGAGAGRGLADAAACAARCWSCPRPTSSWRGASTAPPPRASWPSRPWPACACWRAPRPESWTGPSPLIARVLWPLAVLGALELALPVRARRAAPTRAAEPAGRRRARSSVPPPRCRSRRAARPRRRRRSRADPAPAVRERRRPRTSATCARRSSTTCARRSASSRSTRISSRSARGGASRRWTSTSATSPPRSTS